MNVIKITLPSFISREINAAMSKGNEILLDSVWTPSKIRPKFITAILPDRAMI